MENLRKQLQSAKDLLKPDPSWVSKNKNILMNQIRAQATLKQGLRKESVSFGGRQWSFDVFIHTFVPQGLVSVARPALTTFLVMLMALAGWSASVSATFNCIPGDMCWSVKVAHEKTQIAFAAVGASKHEKQEIKIKRNFEFAERRVEEIKQLVEGDHGDTSRRVNAANKHLQESISTAVGIANEEVKQKINEDPGKALALAKDTQKETEIITKELKDITANPQTVQNTEVVRQVSEVAQRVDDKILDPIETIVKSGIAENGGLKDEVKSLVNGALNTLLEDNEKVKKDADSSVLVKSADGSSVLLSGSVSSTFALSSSTISTNFISSTVSRTEDTPKIISNSSTNANIANQAPQTTQIPLTSEAKEQVKEKTTEVDNSAQKVKNLIEEGKLQEAFQTIKDLGEITNVAEHILIEAQGVAVTTPPASLGAPVQIAPTSATGTNSN